MSRTDLDLKHAKGPTEHEGFNSGYAMFLPTKIIHAFTPGAVGFGAQTLQVSRLPSKCHRRPMVADLENGGGNGKGKAP